MGIIFQNNKACFNGPKNKMSYLLVLIPIVIIAAYIGALSYQPRGLPPDDARGNCDCGKKAIVYCHDCNKEFCCEPCRCKHIDHTLE